MNKNKTASNEYFKEIAKTRNISLAAENLGISQPALSAYLKRLETAIGSTLVDRSATPLTITDAGLAYLNYLEKVEILGRDLAQELDDYEKMQKGHIAVGGAVFFNVTYLPSAIAEFNNLFPGINIEIIDGKIPEITNEAMAGRIDVFTTPEKSDEDVFYYEEMFHENIFLCLPPDWEINKQLPTVGANGYATLSETEFDCLKESTFIVLHDDQDIGRKMNALFNKHHFTPRHVVTASQTLTTLELTMAGVGISLITESTLNNYNSEKKPRAYLIDPEICSRSMYVAYPKHRYASNATKEFIKILIRHNQ